MPDSASSPATLFIAHDTEASGAPRITARLAVEFAARGRRAIACFPHKGDLEEELRAAGIETWIVENPPVSLAAASLGRKLRLGGRRLAAVLGYWRAARRPEVELIWVGSSVLLPAILGAALAGKPLVVHVHEVLRPTHGNRLRVALIRGLARAVAFDARAGQDAFQPQPPGQRWAVLHNWAETRQFQSVAPGDRESLRAELDAAPEDVVFTTVAFVSHRKGIDVLLDAFAEVAAAHPRARLWIAGAAPPDQEAFAAQCRTFVAERGLAERVSFLGHRADVPRVLLASDVFVLASRNEALPLSILEGMEARLPCVATDVGSVRDLILPGETGAVVPSEDARALAAAMAPYASDEALRHVHGEAGARHAREHFAKDAIITQAVELADWCGGAA